MPGILGDDADGHPVGRVRAAVEVLHEQLALAHMLQNPLQQRVKPHRREGLVHLSPVDQRVSRLVVHGELVFGAAPGARPGDCQQRAIGGQRGLATLDRCLN